MQPQAFYFHLLLELENEGNILHMKQVLANLNRSIRSRFDEHEKDKLFQLAAVLDPRFKFRWCEGSTVDQI